MRRQYIHYYLLLIVHCSLLIGSEGASAQHMPVVYDRSYGDGLTFSHACPMPSGDVLLAGVSGSGTGLVWASRDGDVLFSRVLRDCFTDIGDIRYLGNDVVLLCGSGIGRSPRGGSGHTQGRAVVIDIKGRIRHDFSFGGQGSHLTTGRQLKDGNFLFGGYDVLSDGRLAGVVIKTSPSGGELYKYTSAVSGACIGLDVLGSDVEYVHAAFSSVGLSVRNKGSQGSSGSSVVRLESSGRPVFITEIEDKGFHITRMASGSDDHIYVTGRSSSGGERLIKIRPEGNVVFDKQIVPPSASATGGGGLSTVSPVSSGSSTSSSVAAPVPSGHLYLSDSGNILTGGNHEGMCYFSLLRSDGTDIEKYVVVGTITGMGMDAVSGMPVVIIRNGGVTDITGLAPNGKKIFSRESDGYFDRVMPCPSGTFLASTSTGRLGMVSPSGDMLFDRYVSPSGSEGFSSVLFVPNGEVLFIGSGNRVIKAGHGLYVSDVSIGKPVTGFATAVFTVTLTGYSTSESGVAQPVIVEYFTEEGSARVGSNFSPVRGRLSFVPVSAPGGSYMVRQEVEVPVCSNNLMEGSRYFSLRLDNVSNSYPIRPSGTATIRDHDVVVRLKSTSDGLEGTDDIVYELGLEKTNGDLVVNATGSDVVVSGGYGKGTADSFDFDGGVSPRVVIPDNSSSGRFSVRTFEDTRYELPKTVVIDFNKIFAVNDANIGFDGSVLRCTGKVVDRPAVISVSPLGRQGRTGNNVSGFFRVTLHRHDGVPLTNDTGGDIRIHCKTGDSTTVTEGKDFVFTNLRDLRFRGDGSLCAVNLNGLVLYGEGSASQGQGQIQGSSLSQHTGRSLGVEIVSVDIPEGAPGISTTSAGGSAQLTISN